MSVHGEYSRALENLIAALRAEGVATSTPIRAGEASASEGITALVDALEAARVDRCADLSEAARRGLQALEMFETRRDPGGDPSASQRHLSASPATHEAAAGPDSSSPASKRADHLLAHCRLILGIPS